MSVDGHWGWNCKALPGAGLGCKCLFVRKNKNVLDGLLKIDEVTMTDMLLMFEGF